MHNQFVLSFHGRSHKVGVKVTGFLDRDLTWRLAISLTAHLQRIEEIGAIYPNPSTATRKTISLANYLLVRVATVRPY